MIRIIVTTLAAAVCRQAERGLPPCYQCCDVVERLWLIHGRAP
jgi:hypothetical protein